MIFRTASGSSYEVDLAGKKIRRLFGPKPATERQGLDGEWKQYEDALEPIVGRSFWVVWRYEDGVARSTFTSTVVSIEDVS